MSAKYCQLFTNQPIEFLQSYSVDIKTWFENLMRRNDASATLGRGLVTNAETTKNCQIDFEPVGGVFGLGVDTVEAKFTALGGVSGYWVPYHAGTELPGWADVPRDNPAHRFVFTAGMNGCAFEITESPLGPQYMRVYHNQHPESQLVNDKLKAQNQKLLSRADFSDYGGAQLPPGKNPVAFNFLYYKGGSWAYVFQPQSFDALSNAPAKKQDAGIRAKSIF